ncbi:peptidoglycan DD-metalloendopeptidase family protein [Corallincola platygyrae]|uniref:Peptidoglycan DD-metalloendopeptidase family protein n=1 Tax=Corallincola platygyrae TaxID=1193278 RepID=A0ABW4XIJ4_9GAMM
MILMGVGLLVAVGVMMPSSRSPIDAPISISIELPLTQNAAEPVSDIIEETVDVELPNIQLTIAQGDTLSGLFSKIGISQQTMYQVLESDQTILALDTLKPGNRLSFWVDDLTRELTALELYFDPSRQVRFERVSDSHFTYNEILVDGEWQSVPLRGEVHGSLYQSAAAAGLTARDVQQIEGLFKEKVKFGRDFRAGDNFFVLRNEQLIDGERTGNTDIQAVVIEVRGKQLSAFRHSDGSYYDAQGQGLAKAFLRVPLKKRYRISDHFNPRRKHPVTGRIAPHNGTDFATPTGTPILAAGDGVVSLVAKHRYAGKYVVIDHGGSYRTRYLHLSRSKVRKGQRVSRGQVIALSGATGRVSGAHLHYEFHINGRPVDAMKANIPMAKSLSGKELKQFKKLVAERMELLEVD